MKYKKRNWLLLKLVNADEKFLSVGKELELLGVGKVSWSLCQDLVNVTRSLLDG